MSNIRKTLLITILSLASLVSCGESQAAAAKCTDAFLSPSTLTYVNMRPNYNYYLTTFTFQGLEIFDDNSYQLTVSASTYSALILPEEGNAIQGNERTNSLTKYYGTFTSTVDDLDPDGLNIVCSIPTKITLLEDSTYFADSSNWTEDMTKKTAVTKIVYDDATGQQTTEVVKEFKSGAEYLEYFTWSKEMTFIASKAKNSLEYQDLALIDHSAK